MPVKITQAIDKSLLPRITKFGVYGDSFNSILTRIVTHYETCIMKEQDEK